MANVYTNRFYIPTTTAQSTVYTCPTTARAIIQNIQITNHSGSHEVEAFVYDTSGATTVEIGHTSLASKSLTNMAAGPIILEEGDSLLLTTTDTTNVRGIISILEVNRD